MNCGPDNDMLIAYRWDLAEIRRMQRTEEETAALYGKLARQRIRAILAALLIALSGCTGCVYGRDYTVVGTNEHVCLDP